MTNEELCEIARTGDEDALLALWNQTRRLAFKEARRWMSAGNGLELEDIQQECFLGFLNAVKHFDSTASVKFSTYLTNCTRWGLWSAAGLRKPHEPLRCSYASLDEPLLTSDGEPADTLKDLLEDPGALQAFDHAELFGCLEPYLVELPPEQQDALYRKFWLQIPADGKAVSKALRFLRHPDRSKKLKELYCII